MLFDLSFSLISASYNPATFISVEKQNSHTVETQNRIAKADFIRFVQESYFI